MTKRISLILVAALVSVVAGGALLTQASAVHAAAGVTTQTITAPAAAAADRFGFAAGISGDGKTAVVGAPGTNPPTAGDVGKAFVFTRKDGTWSLPQQLVPTPSLPQDFFGGAVSLSRDGHVALVGAPGNLFASGQFNQQASPGAAFIFTEHDGQWTQQAMLTASPAGLPGDSFGYSVALSSDGHEALVGAVGESGIEGAAYLFVQKGKMWILDAKLTDPGNPAPTPGDSFGFSVALSNDGHEALVGADQGGPTGQAPNGPGFADVYVQHGGVWPATPSHQLTASDGSDGDAFGDAVALSRDGHTALIGAEAKVFPDFTGAAYTFSVKGDTWSERQEVAGTDSASGDSFGYSVAVDDDADTALIGALSAHAFSYMGRAYRFAGKVGAWSQTREQSEAVSDYGSAVALDHDGKVELVGADGEDGNAGNGVVYAYEFG